MRNDDSKRFSSDSNGDREQQRVASAARRVESKRKASQVDASAEQYATARVDIHDYDFEPERWDGLS